MQSQHRDAVDDAKRRLDWSRRRLDEFHAEAARLLDGVGARGHYEPIDHEHVRTWFVVDVSADASALVELRCLAGEVIHGLRSTVNNLVWAAGQSVGAPERFDLTFCKSKGEYRSRVGKIVDRLPSEIANWYQSVQPFSMPEGAKHVLHRLHDLWNGDKHRLPVLVVYHMDSVHIQGGPLFMTDLRRHGGPVNDGDTLFGCRIPRSQIDTLKPTFSFRLVFRSNGWCAREYLELAEQDIRGQVMPLFERNIGEGPTRFPPNALDTPLKSTAP